MPIIARELAWEKGQKEYNLEISSIDLEEIRQEINKTLKKFKKNDNFDKISVKINIKYHKNGDYLFFKGL